MLYDGEDDEVLKIAQNIVLKLQKPYIFDTEIDYISASVGITKNIISRHQTVPSILKEADKAMYISKMNGRNQYTFYICND